MVKNEVGIEPATRDPRRNHLDRVATRGQRRLAECNQTFTDIRLNRATSGDEGTLFDLADWSVDLWCEQAMVESRRARAGAGGGELHEPGRPDLTPARADQLAAVQDEIPVFDVDKRIDCRALVGAESNLREQERPAMQLEQGASVTVRGHLPGEHFHVAVGRRLDPDFQDQPVVQTDRR